MDAVEHLHCFVRVAILHGVHRHQGQPCYVATAVSFGETASPSVGVARSTPGFAGFVVFRIPLGSQFLE
jgi:hypothetical protein